MKGYTFMKEYDIEKLITALTGIGVFKNDALPPRTMYVSSDVFELLKSDAVTKNDTDKSDV